MLEWNGFQCLLKIVSQAHKVVYFYPQVFKTQQVLSHQNLQTQ